MAKLVYDVGLHNGNDTDFYLKKGYDVVAIECVPHWIKHAKERFAAEMAQGRLVLVETAIDDEEGERAFYFNEDLPEWSSLKKEVAKRDGHRCSEIKVQCRTLDSVVKEYGEAYYIKIDVDGSMREAVDSLQDSDVLPPLLSVEGAGFITALHSMGYQAFKIINQEHIPKQRPPYPAREGNYIDYFFNHGSSGLFGEEIPGEWKDFETIQQALEQLKDLTDMDPFSGWYDVHARMKSVGPEDNMSKKRIHI